MFHHVVVGGDVAVSRPFYDAVLGALGIAPAQIDPSGRAVYMAASMLFIVGAPIDGRSPTAANGGTIAFVAAGADAVDAWHAAGLAQGGTRCEDPPGIRRSDYGAMYVAYLRDPAGNKICALHHLPS